MLQAHRQRQYYSRDEFHGLIDCAGSWHRYVQETRRLQVMTIGLEFQGLEKSTDGRRTKKRLGNANRVFQTPIRARPLADDPYSM